PLALAAANRCRVSHRHKSSDTPLCSYNGGRAAVFFRVDGQRFSSRVSNLFLRFTTIAKARVESQRGRTLSRNRSLRNDVHSLDHYRDQHGTGRHCRTDCSELSGLVTHFIGAAFARRRADQSESDRGNYQRGRRQFRDSSGKMTMRKKRCAAKISPGVYQSFERVEMTEPDRTGHSLRRTRSSRRMFRRSEKLLLP